MTSLKEFWSELPEGEYVHPKDKPFLDANPHTFQTTHRPPGPFNGPLFSAKIIVCYANPGFSIRDADYAPLIANQLSGFEPLPDIPHWQEWYEPIIFVPIGLPFDYLRKITATFNICPYPSVKMAGVDMRLAAGLPSAWLAQKYLREELIPKALRGEVFLVFARKHQLWGVIEGFHCPNIVFSRNRRGHIGTENGTLIRSWLEKNLPSN